MSIISVYLLLFWLQIVAVAIPGGLIAVAIAADAVVLFITGYEKIKITPATKKEIVSWKKKRKKKLNFWNNKNDSKRYPKKENINQFDKFTNDKREKNDEMGSCEIKKTEKKKRIVEKVFFDEKTTLQFYSNLETPKQTKNKKKKKGIIRHF